MKSFAYERPGTVTEAVQALADRPTAKVLAGGTNLVDLMRLGVETPSALIDVNRLDFGGIDRTDDGGLLIGAGVRNSDLAAHPLIRARYPALSKALLSGASGQLRNMASTGGNLLQRTRCFYFSDPTKPCNKREPGTGCSAIEGESRELAILGGSEACIATYPGDMAVALTALEAVIHFETVNGRASAPINDFYRLPGNSPDQDTSLPPGALVIAIELPALAFGHHSTYRKARDRRSFAFGLATVAAALDLDGGNVRDVRLALGGVAHKPWRARTAEVALRGQPATPQSYLEAIRAELAVAQPTKQNAFKVELVERLVVGTLHELTGAKE